MDDCIEYGLDCKSPSVRFDFFNFYNDLWHNSCLVMKLYIIMSGEISYNLEFSLAFYIELLLVEIRKDTQLEGNFQLIKKKNVRDDDEPVRFHL